MVTATFADVVAAHAQGTITQVHVQDHSGKNVAHMGNDKPVTYAVPGTNQSYARGSLAHFGAFLLSIVALTFGYGSYQGAKKRRERNQRVMNSPLIS